MSSRAANSAPLPSPTYAYVLENGRVVGEGSGAELAAREDIQHFYLGGKTG